MNTELNHGDSGQRSRPATVEELAQAADRFAGFHRISWREALGRFASAAFRLHHYRDIRTRMLYDAFCAVECKTDPCETDDD